MRVAVLTNNYIPVIGGAEIFAVALARFLVERGHEVDIITIRQNKTMPKFEVIGNVNIYRIDVLKHVGFLSSYLGMLRTLLRLNKQKKYDLIHSIAEAPTSQVSTTFKKLKNKPNIITIQGGHLIRKNFNESLKNRILEKIVKWSFNNADVVHVISSVLAEESKRLGANNVVILPNGVNEDMIAYKLKDKIRTTEQIKPDEKVIVCMARLVPLKGVKYVIRAFSRVVKKYPDSRLIIIGDGIQKPELEKITQELGICDKVDFRGFIPHKDIKKILPAADVFAVTPEYEGLGNVYIEAMACGVPVIATKVGGIPDIIKEGQNGIFVPHGNVDKLSETLEKILLDKDIQQKFRKEGIKTIKQKFTWKCILLNIENIYLELS